MPEQNLKNHVRLVIPFHVFTLLGILILLVISVINIINADKKDLLTAWSLTLIAIIALSFFYYIRTFSLKAQDRAIRAEEHLRYFILTGRPIDKKLTLGQIIALRFASDEEFPALVSKALQEQLGNKAIKKEIRNWRSDHHRV